MARVDEVLAEAVARLTSQAGTPDNPRQEAELLLQHVLGKPRSWLFTWPEAELTDESLTAFHSLLEKRLAGTPVAHLMGQTEFWSLPLEVTPDTLIPRPDTETLVEQALQLALPEQACVLDLGTGTGAIALALASERPAWRVSGSDLVPEAVTLAQRNACLLGLERVRFFRSDWFGDLETGGWDLIVSNPPYVADQDPHLALGDVRHEPRSALTGGADGLDAIRHLVRMAPDWLNDGGWLALEHGYDQGQPVAQLLRDSGYEQVAGVSDLAGQPRVTLGRKSRERNR